MVVVIIILSFVIFFVSSYFVGNAVFCTFKAEREDRLLSFIFGMVGWLVIILLVRHYILLVVSLFYIICNN